MSITSSNLSRASTSISSYNSHDPKMNVKKFEAHKAFYEPSTDSKMYKQMRRAVRPTMTLFLFARHSDNRFYEDYWYLYPTGKPQDCDYNSILREKKRSAMSSRITNNTEKLPKIAIQKPKKNPKVDEFITEYIDYHETQNHKSTKFFT